jgi:hypothetical protein
VGGEGGSDGRLDEGGHEPREDWGYAAEDAGVEDFGLGEIGNLGGTANVGRGGKNGVLEDGPQEGVGA